jgi:hypothetical protein
MSKAEFEMKLNDVTYWRVPLVQQLKMEERSMTKGDMMLLVEISCDMEINSTAIFIENG